MALSVATFTLFSPTVVPGGGVTSGGRSGLKKQDIIAIVIGVGGFLLILIIVCTLVLLKRTKKRGVGKLYHAGSTAMRFRIKRIQLDAFLMRFCTFDAFRYISMRLHVCVFVCVFVLVCTQPQI